MNFNYVTLDIHPVFGFETSGTWVAAITQGRHKADESASTKQREAHLETKSSTSAHSLSSSHPRRIEYKWGAEARVYANNISKLLSYIPILSVITGIARIAFSANEYRKNLKYPNSNERDPNHYLQLQENKVALKHIARGVTEIFLGIFSLSHFLIIPDLIQTGFYNMAARKQLEMILEAQI